MGYRCRRILNCVGGCMVAIVSLAACMPGSSQSSTGSTAGRTTVAPPSPAAEGCQLVRFEHQQQPSGVPTDSSRVVICPDEERVGDILDAYKGAPLEVRVDHLVAFVHSQPEYLPPTGDMECPADMGPQFVLLFQNPAGEEARIWADVSGCGGTLGRDASAAVLDWLSGDVEASNLP